MKSHWNLRYIKNRILSAVFEKRHQDEPWFAKGASDALNTLLKPSDIGVEFGSGRSTLWFAERMAHLTSVEHHEGWYKTVSAKIKAMGNVDYIHVPVGGLPEDGGETAYVEPLEKMAVESADFILVDGQYRGQCATTAISRLKPGGMLVIDNVNWFIPSDSISPNSRKMSEGPSEKEGWPEVYDKIVSWRNVWFDSGVTATAIYFKP